jgi:hypothetical protein
MAWAWHQINDIFGSDIWYCSRNFRDAMGRKERHVRGYEQSAGSSPRTSLKANQVRFFS